MEGYQPNAPPRPVAIPVPAEDAHVVQAIAAAPAIERPAVADVHQPSRQRQFCDVSSRRQELVRTIDDVVSGAADPDDPRHASLDLKLGSVG